MDNIDIEKKNGIGKKKVKSEKAGEVIEQEQFRLVLNKDTNTVLEEFVEKVNKDFRGGTATKSIVANYVFQNLKNFLSDSDIKAIHHKCFDDKEALLALGKSEKGIPEAVKKAIREAYGLLEKDKKRSSKALSELSTELPVDNI